MQYYEWLFGNGMTATTSPTETRAGFGFAFAAFGFWGLVQPYFFDLFADWGALVIMAHRTVWSCLFMWVWLVFRGKVTGALALFTDARLIGILTLTGVLVAANWGTYIYAVQAGRLLDASIGYFMTPLMTAAFGIVILGERPRRLQIWALAFAAAGVLFYTVAMGQLPIIALFLSLSFSAYGGIRKLYAIPAERGMAVETTLIGPIALILIFTYGWVGGPYLIATSGREAVLLILAGLVTLLPLVWYNAAAARMPLLSLGLLQFIVPIGLFILSMLPPLNETLDAKRAVLFAAIWTGLVFYVVDLLSHARRSARVP